VQVVRHADVKGPPGAALQYVDVEAIFTQHTLTLLVAAELMQCE
jgi:hypothetical protein